MTAAFAHLHALQQDMYRTLTRAQEERPDREDLVDDYEPGWVLYERETMHSAVNQARADRSLPPVPIAAVKRVEQQAFGHSDYTKKFALYCAELALKEQP